MTIGQIIKNVIKLEGGYVNHPDDKGGPTKYGVTEKVARAHGYTGNMVDLSEVMAFDIYYQEYCVKPQFDKIYDISPDIAAELVDTGINMGTKTAVEFLQVALNALNNQGKAFIDVAVDGYAGPKTLYNLGEFLRKRGKEGETVLYNALNCLQGAKYIALAQSRQQNESFVYGWLKERISVRSQN